jgi:hypothetical protein
MKSGTLYAKAVGAGITVEISAGLEFLCFAIGSAP